MKYLAAVAVGSMTLAMPGCDDPKMSAPDEMVDQGERVFRSRVEDGNSFTCATCHAVREPTDDGLVRPGHPLGGATRRPSFKNGQLADFRDAMNSCLTEWMNAEPWSETDTRHEALWAYLDGQADASSEPAISFEIVQPLAAEALAGGDPNQGRALFNGTCAVCHGDDGTGTDQALPVGSGGFDPMYVATRVRTSGRSDSPVYDGLTGGVMPFWALDRLSDDDLRDIVAWMSRPTEVATDDTSGDGDTGSGDDSGGDVGGNCPTTHPMVGSVAYFEQKFHNVGGMAEIVDDCTIVLREFTYDGAGIDVRLYGGLGGDYDNGFAMGDDLVRSGGYDGDTLEFILPPDKSLNDLDGVSVWCVDVGVDFGSASFDPP